MSTESDSSSPHLPMASSNRKSRSEIPLSLVPYSVRLRNNKVSSIIANRDAYVDSMVASSKVAKGTVVFELNTFDLDRESFKIAKDLALADLTMRRLVPPWLTNLVIEPLEAGIRYADEDVQTFAEILRATRDRFRVGEITKTDVCAAEAQYME